MTRFDLDLRDRRRLFADLERDVFDIAVIGAGITGAGIARDAAMRGFSVALIEARDFAAGTSSRSTKLVHGGLRYLAQGDTRLVREASTERKVVKTIAPHLARPIRFLLPATSRAGVAKLSAGLWTYERLGGVEKEDRHELWNGERLAREEPALVTDAISAAIVYTEYVTDDGRLTLANVRSAKGHGAIVANYAEVRSVRSGALTVRDHLAHDGATATVRARVIVNASGPWADRIRQLEDPNADARLQLSKGVHLVLPRARLPIHNTINVVAADKRGMFAIPRGDVVYVGTTDTFYRDCEYWPEITAADIDYLLEATNRTFNGAPRTRADVCGYWAGIRPLIAEPGKSPSEISRRDEVMVGPTGMITIAGGKLTAFRRMAERVVDLCARRLDADARPCATASELLPGADEAPADTVAGLESRGLPTRDADRLMRLYGSEAHDVVGEGVAGEVRQAVLKEGAATLEDYWVRRSARAHFDVDGGLAVLDEAATIMGGLLGWTAEARAEQLRVCRALAEDELQSLAKTA